jgi:phage terminase large subunit-like protein
MLLVSSAELEHLSPAQRLVELCKRDPGLIRRALSGMTDAQAESLLYDSNFWLRKNQIPPEVFEVCLILAGRGFGKTFSGAAWVIRKAQAGARRIALVGPTSADVRDTMIQGVSGIIANSPPWFMPKYEPSKRRLVWPNGTKAHCYSADKPDRLRGPNCDAAWCDEISSWSHNMEAWEQVKLILRLGSSPQAFITTTPKPLKKLQEIIEAEGTVVIRGSTFDNAANLSPSFIRQMKALAATRWGRQELLGELLLDVVGALFKMKWFDESRVDVPPGEDPTRFSRAFNLERVVVVVDPAPTANAGSDETGIIVAGVGTHRETGDRHVYVLADYTMKGSPQEWGLEVVKAYHRHQADAVVVETNSGGDFVPTILENIDPNVPVKQVRAKAGKSKRAEPVSAIAEIGRVHLVGTFPKLEEQLKRFSGINGRRDDRADAMCWAAHELALTEQIYFA